MRARTICLLTALLTIAASMPARSQQAPKLGLNRTIKPLEPPPSEPMGRPSEDVGDVSWNVPMVYMRYPANIPNLPGHSWPDAVAMATPIAHKGSTAGAAWNKISDGPVRAEQSNRRRIVQQEKNEKFD